MCVSHLVELLDILLLSLLQQLHHFIMSGHLLSYNACTEIGYVKLVYIVVKRADWLVRHAIQVNEQFRKGK